MQKLKRLKSSKEQGLRVNVNINAVIERIQQ